MAMRTHAIATGSVDPGTVTRVTRWWTAWTSLAGATHDVQSLETVWGTVVRPSERSIKPGRKLAVRQGVEPWVGV
jgi:hypothetical protein